MNARGSTTVGRTDDQLVAAAQSGDRAAFEQLVRAHRDRVWSLVRTIVRHPEDAADVTQETFIAVLRHLDTFERTAKFTTWLHRIAVRKAYDHLRRRVPEPIDPTDGPPVVDTSDPFEQQLQRSAIVDALAALDPGFRAAVALVDLFGHSIEEVAEILDIAPGTVKSRVFRGRAALARQLSGTGKASGASQ